MQLFTIGTNCEVYVFGGNMQFGFSMGRWPVRIVDGVVLISATLFVPTFFLPETGRV